jgi:hypothetical protein
LVLVLWTKQAGLTAGGGSFAKPTPKRERTKVTRPINEYDDDDVVTLSAEKL